jgi:hypothetical protein
MADSINDGTDRFPQAGFAWLLSKSNNSGVPVVLALTRLVRRTFAVAPGSPMGTML